MYIHTYIRSGKQLTLVIRRADAEVRVQRHTLTSHLEPERVELFWNAQEHVT